MNSLVTLRAAAVTLIFTTLGSCAQSTSPAASHPELEIELTAPTENIGNLANQRAPSDARIKLLKLVPEVFEENSHTARQLAPEELGGVAFQGASIQLRGEAEQATTHQAPNGKYFTVQDLLDAVVSDIYWGS